MRPSERVVPSNHGQKTFLTHRNAESINARAHTPPNRTMSDLHYQYSCRLFMASASLMSRVFCLRVSRLWLAASAGCDWLLWNAFERSAEALVLLFRRLHCPAISAFSPLCANGGRRKISGRIIRRTLDRDNTSSGLAVRVSVWDSTPSGGVHQLGRYY